MHFKILLRLRKEFTCQRTRAQTTWTADRPLGLHQKRLEEESSCKILICVRTRRRRVLRPSLTQKTSSTSSSSETLQRGSGQQLGTEIVGDGWVQDVVVEDQLFEVKLDSRYRMYASLKSFSHSRLLNSIIFSHIPSSLNESTLSSSSFPSTYLLNRVLTLLCSV